MSDEDPVDPLNDEPLPTEQPTVDAASPTQFRRRASRARLEAKESTRFWQGILSTEVGRREMWGLLMSAHTFETRFAAGPTGFPDPNATWFAAGEKAFGERFYATLMQHDVAAVIAMHIENDTRIGPIKPKDEADGRS